jgi:hypothetical protein
MASLHHLLFVAFLSTWLALASAADRSCGKTVYDNQKVLCPALATEAQCTDKGNGYYCYWSDAQRCEAFPAKAICTQLANILQQAAGGTHMRATGLRTHAVAHTHAGMSPTEACAYMPKLGMTGCEYDSTDAFLYCQCKEAYVPPPRTRDGWGDCQGRHGPPGLNAPCLSLSNSTCEASTDGSCVYEDASCTISKDRYCSVANVEPACGHFGTECGADQCAQNPLCKWNPAGHGSCETNWIQECPYLGCTTGDDQFACRCLPPSASPTTAAPTTATPTTAPATAAPTSPTALSAAAPPARVSRVVLLLASCVAIALAGV